MNKYFISTFISALLALSNAESDTSERILPTIAMMAVGVGLGFGVVIGASIGGTVEHNQQQNAAMAAITKAPKFPKARRTPQPITKAPKFPKARRTPQSATQNQSPKGTQNPATYWGDWMHPIADHFFAYEGDPGAY